MVSPVGKKRDQGGHPAPPALWDTSQETHRLTSQGSLGESVGHDHWGSDRGRAEGQVLQQPVLRSWQTAFLLIAANKQRSLSAALPTCRAELEVLSDQGAQLAVLPSWVLSQQDIQAMEPVLWPCLGKEANSQPRPTA